MKYKITNIVNADVIIEDLSIRLPGKGSNVIIDANIANRSRDLVVNRNLIRIDKIGEKVPMPIWPFVKSKKLPDPTPESNATQKDLSDIKSMLADILLRMNSESASKTVIKKVIAVSQNQVPEILEVQEPMFIPSKIMPDQAEVDIKLREREVSKTDLSEGIKALKKLRSR
jgi:hypothetical protein